jgi:hypothetical protein
MMCCKDEIHLCCKDEIHICCNIIDPNEKKFHPASNFHTLESPPH